MRRVPAILRPWTPAGPGRRSRRSGYLECGGEGLQEDMSPNATACLLHGEDAGGIPEYFL